MADLRAPVPSLRRLPDRSAKNEILPDGGALYFVHPDHLGDIVIWWPMTELLIAPFTAWAILFIRIVLR